MKQSLLFLAFIILNFCLSAQNTLVSKHDTIPGTNLFYENRVDILEAPDCNPSEAYLKKKIKGDLAGNFGNYPSIAVDFISFKGQDGFTDKKNAEKIVYPYQVEMFVHVKRLLIKEGKNFTEFQTWKFERVYEYATMPGKKCEFKHTSSNSRLVSSEMVEVKSRN